MIDEVLKELWTTKDTLAKEHGYSMDRLAEYFQQQESAGRGQPHRDQPLDVEHDQRIAAGRSM